jgi:hypothetical protein
MEAIHIQFVLIFSMALVVSVAELVVEIAFYEKFASFGAQITKY